MKTLSLTLLTFLLLIICNTKVSAQNEDYIITIHGDTIKGKFVGNKFQDSRLAKPKRLNLDTIKETYNDKDKTVSRAVHISTGHQRVFMTMLEKGKLNLYEKDFSMNSYMNNQFSYSAITRWFVAKGTDTVEEIKNTNFTVSALFFKSQKKRKNDLAEMLSDNKSVYNKYIADDKLTFKGIRNIIHLYNTGEPLAESAK